MTSSPRPRILLITTKADIAADYVVLKLTAQTADFYRINTDEFPLAASSTVGMKRGNLLPTWSWSVGRGERICLDGVKSIWFRRHRLPVLPSEMDDAHIEYCLRESDWFFRGALYTRQAVWMSDPVKTRQAESKIHQLSTAQTIGFRIPKTIFTNDAELVRAFFDEHSGRIVAKPVRLGYFDYGDRQTSVFTSEVHRDDLQNDQSIQIAPVIYQELIPKVFDIRVTIVGDDIFVAAIDSQSIPSARIDWRRSETDDLGHSVHSLPPVVAQRCVALLHQLGLRFGALDLVLTPEGEYVFLEINPNGQWAWIEDRLGLPISSSIASWLLTKSCHA